jgi:hypothetical protein
LLPRLVIAGILIALLSLPTQAAGNLSSRLFDGLTGCWSRNPADEAGVERTLCFDGKWTVDAVWLGTSEGLQDDGRYVVFGNTIMFSLPSSAGGWPWDWVNVTCRVGIESNRLTLSACVGTGGSVYVNNKPNPVVDLVYERETP